MRLYPLSSLTIALLAALAALASGTASAEATATSQFVISAPCPAVGFAIERQTPSSGLNPERIRVLSWNIQKSNIAGWQQELQRLASQADLVLLQEARLQADVMPILDHQSFGTFAPGYATATQDTGVMTLSTISASAHCALQHQEPWLGTPKATSLSYFKINQSLTNLLVVNLHGVNFTLTADSLTAQLDDIASLIERHTGPVVYGGDFNTWSEARKEALSHSIADLNLQGVTFTDDKRIRVLGNPLDHLLVRGLQVLESHTYPVSSSDHNPISVTLALEPVSSRDQTVAL
jgi:endonuclease/exonuclease/phosphatase (EEP) superfamily protein YafD